MRMKGVRSLREMTRILDADPRLRKLCLIKKKEKAYPRSVLSRFTRKVGEDKLALIIEEKVVKLLKQNDAKEVDAVFDASFIKAWSTRDPLNNQEGYSDMEARVGRAGRTFGLGYKLYLSIDSKTMLPGSVYPCHVLSVPKFLLGNVRQTKLSAIVQESSLLRRLTDLDFTYMKGGSNRLRQLLDNAVCLGEVYRDAPEELFHFLNNEA